MKRHTEALHKHLAESAKRCAEKLGAPMPFVIEATVCRGSDDFFTSVYYKTKSPLTSCVDDLVVWLITKYTAPEEFCTLATEFEPFHDDLERWVELTVYCAYLDRCRKNKDPHYPGGDLYVEDESILIITVNADDTVTITEKRGG
jgi:hypothetical protein